MKDFQINPDETDREREIRVCQSPAFGVLVFGDKHYSSPSELVLTVLIHLALSRQRFEIDKQTYISSYNAVSQAAYDVQSWEQN